MASAEELEVDYGSEDELAEAEVRQGIQGGSSTIVGDKVLERGDREDAVPTGSDSGTGDAQGRRREEDERWHRRDKGQTDKWDDRRGGRREDLRVARPDIRRGAGQDNRRDGHGNYKHRKEHTLREHRDQRDNNDGDYRWPPPPTRGQPPPPPFPPADAMMAMMLEQQQQFMMAAMSQFVGLNRGNGRGYRGRGGRGRGSFTYKRERDAEEERPVKEHVDGKGQGEAAEVVTGKGQAEKRTAEERAKLIEAKKKRIEELERLATAKP